MTAGTGLTDLEHICRLGHQALPDMLKECLAAKQIHVHCYMLTSGRIGPKSFETDISH
jgi:hypothetical protein